MAISTKVKTTTLVKKPITKKVTIKKPIVNKLKKETIVVTDNDIKNVLVYNNPIKEIKLEDRAPNNLDRKPDDHESKKLTDIVEDFCEEGVLEEIEELYKAGGLG